MKRLTPNGTTLKAIRRLATLVMLAAFGLPLAAQDAPPPPVIRLEVNPLTANLGDTVTVAVRLENVVNLYGLQVSCQADPTSLLGLTRIDGDAFASGSSYWVDQGMKPDGKWLIAATKLQPNPAFNGSGTAFSFQYTLQTAANTSLNCAALGVDNRSTPLPLTLVNGAPVITAVLPITAAPTVEIPTALPTEIVPTAEATPDPTVELPPTVEATLEPTAAASLSGTIQGVIVKQYGSDGSGIIVQLTNSGSLVAESLTAADGRFTFTDVPAGSYVLLVSAPNHLALVYNLTVAGDGAAIDVGSQVFLIGDTDSNQTIDVADAALVSANFDVAVPPAPEAADLNHDGLVNISDLVLIGNNFGSSGPVVVQ